MAGWCTDRAVEDLVRFRSSPVHGRHGVRSQRRSPTGSTPGGAEGIQHDHGIGVRGSTDHHSTGRYPDAAYVHAPIVVMRPPMKSPAARRWPPQLTPRLIEVVVSSGRVVSTGSTATMVLGILTTCLGGSLLLGVDPGFSLCAGLVVYALNAVWLWHLERTNDTR